MNQMIGTINGGEEFHRNRNQSDRFGRFLIGTFNKRLFN